METQEEMRKLNLGEQEILVMKRCREGNKGYDGFEYPEAGKYIKAPHWDDDYDCENGLFGLAINAQTYDWTEYSGNYVILLVNKKEGFVDMREKVKFRIGKVLYNGSSLEYVKRFMQLHYPTMWFHKDVQHSRKDDDFQKAGVECEQKMFGDAGVQIAMKKSTQSGNSKVIQQGDGYMIQKGGFNSLQNASYNAEQTALDYSLQNARENAKQVAQDSSVQKSGNFSNQRAGRGSIQKTLQNGRQIGENHVIQYAEGYSWQTAEQDSVQVISSFGYGTQEAKENSVQIGTGGNRQVAEKACIQISEKNSTQIAGERALQSAGTRSLQKSGSNSVIVVNIRQDEINLVRTDKNSVIVMIDTLRDIAASEITMENDILYAIDGNANIVSQYIGSPTLENLFSLKSYEIYVFDMGEGEHDEIPEKLLNINKDYKEKRAYRGQWNRGLKGGIYRMRTEKIEDIRDQIEDLYACAKVYQNDVFLLDRIGRKSSWATDKFMTELFKNAPPNIVKPVEWQLKR